MKFTLSIGLFSILLFSCTKEKRGIAQEILENSSMQLGLPENNKKINGCLYACYKRNYTPGNAGTLLISHAAFTDPANGLMQGFDRFNDYGFTVWGNVDVGNVSFNTKALSKNLSVSTLVYKTFISAQIQSEAIWASEGNRGFSALDIKVNRGFPLALPKTQVTDSISRASNFLFNPDEYFDNYDSLTLYLTDGFPNTKPIKKSLVKGQVVNIPASEFSSFYPAVTQGSILLYAYNYSHQVINSKTYVFELSTKIVRSVYLFP